MDEFLYKENNIEKEWQKIYSVSCEATTTKIHTEMSC